MNKFRIHQQSLFKLQLHKNYLLELTSANFLKLKDIDGNPLTLYETDFKKLYSYLKNQHIDHFPDLATSEKLIHLENAGVRVTRYFSEDNLRNYELDATASAENNLADIVTKNGTKLLKDGKQNCVVVYNNRIYIHPKVRCALGSLHHEILDDPNSKESSNKGVIGVSHSSLSEGHQVAFAGSIVRDKKIGWILENTSGHYITRAHQIKPLLIALRDIGMDLSQFTVKLWIIHDPKLIPPVLKEEDYDIIYENAAEYLIRMEDSQSRYVH